MTNIMENKKAALAIAGIQATASMMIRYGEKHDNPVSIANARTILDDLDKLIAAIDET